MCQAHVINTSHTLIYIILKQPYELSTIIISILDAKSDAQSLRNLPKVTPSRQVAEAGIILRQIGSRVCDIACGSFPTWAKPS